MSDEMDLTRINENFGGNVRARREALGWSQSELARRMNDVGWPKYSQITVARTEDSTRGTRLDEALALAHVLEVDVPAMLQPPGHTAAVGNLRSALQEADSSADRLGAEVDDYMFRLSVLKKELGEVEDYARAKAETLGRREARALETLMEDARARLSIDYTEAISAYMDQIHGDEVSEQGIEDAGDHWAHMQDEMKRGK